MNLKFLFFTILFAALSLNIIHKSGEVNNRPNILLIMIDDMGFSDLGFMGSLIETPNIDKLARNGLFYNNFYNAGRCCPSRAALLTGQYPHKTGMGWMNTADLKHPGYRGMLNQNCVTVAQVLKKNNYACYMTGKWHLTASKNENYYYPSLKYNNKKVRRSNNFYLTSALTDSTVQFLQDHFKYQKDKPFFSYVSYLAPHAPLHALPEDIQKYKGKFMIGWDTLRERKFEQLKRLNIIDSNWTLPERPKHLKKWDELSPEEQKLQDALMAVYAAQLEK